MLMFVADALDELLLVIFAALFITQVAWPILMDRPTFPSYRAWRARRNYKAPVICITPDKPSDTEQEQTRNDE